MTNYRDQRYDTKGINIRPVISVTTNVSKPTGGKPALLSYDEVETIYHEFGHALHGLLSQCHYETISGTSVARDFVELPSQINEHWASEPEVLKVYAGPDISGERFRRQAYLDRRATGRSRQIVEFIRRRGFLAVLLGQEGGVARPMLQKAGAEIVSAS